MFLFQTIYLVFLFSMQIQSNISADLLNINLKDTQFVEIKRNTTVTIICPITPSTTQAATFINWFKNGEKLIWLNKKHIKIIQNNRLQIRQIRFNDNGMYQCQLLNGNGLQKFYNVTIKVVETISNEQSPTTTEVNKIKNKKLLTKFMSKNDDHQDEDGNYDYVQNSDDNQYYDDYYRGEAPTFIDDDMSVLKSINQLEKSTVKLNCNARGTPMPDIIWFKNDKVISEDEIGNIRSSMIVTIKDLSKTDTGNYTCQLTNQYGKIIRNFELKILENLYFDEDMGDENGDLNQNQTVAYGQNALFKCKIVHNVNHFNDKAQIMWFTQDYRTANIAVNKNLSVEIDGYQYYNIDRAINPLKVLIKNENSIFIIKNVDYNDMGYYLCIANNSYGYSYKITYLNVVPNDSSYLNYMNSNTTSFSVVITISCAIIIVLFLFILMYVYKNYCATAKNDDSLKSHETKRASFTKIPTKTNTISSNGSTARFVSHNVKPILSTEAQMAGAVMAVPKQQMFIRSVNTTNTNSMRQSSVTSSSTKYNSSSIATIPHEVPRQLQQQQQRLHIQSNLNYDNFYHVNHDEWSDGYSSTTSNQSRPYAKILNV